MAIVKMKRLRMIGMQSDREELLRLLQRFGCVEIDQPEDRQTQAAWADLSRPDGAALNAARDDGAAAQTALAALKKYAHAKGGLLKSRAVVSEREFFDDGAYADALKTARTINHAERNIASLCSEQSKLRGQKLTLAPWLPLDVPLDAASTREVLVQFGTMPARVSLEAAIAALSDVTELAQLTPASSDQDAHYLLYVCHKSVEDEAAAVLKEYSFSVAALKGWSGTAAENDRRLNESLARLEGEVEAEKALIAAAADQRPALERCVDRANQEIRREEAKSRLLDTASAFYLDGWVPAEKVHDLGALLTPFVCAWETADPTQEEYPDVPVKLKNNWLTRPLSMVTEMYSLPAYDGLDPNPLMAPFFILFYGIMMADMGYGLLMMIASAVVLKKMRPKGGMSHFFGLLGLCGVSTFLMGAVTGGFFGDFLPQLVGILDPDTTFTGLPALFTPLDDTLAILIGAMALGAVQIITGMIISFIKQTKEGHFLDALMDIGSWWLVFLGVGVGALTGFWWVAIAGVAALVCTQGRSSPTLIGKIVGGVGSLYDITGYFGDVLSYSRLMALMLAGSVIAQVFNTLGAIPGNVVIFLVISLVGNTLNFALNLLGCYVHDLRLQCLEYFGKFYKDGGKPFKPLEINTKYVDIAE